VNGPIPQLAGDSPMVHATNRILWLSMAKEAGERYPTAAAMRADLQAALRLPHTPGSAVPEPSGGTALRPPDTRARGRAAGSTDGRPATPTGPPPGSPPAPPDRPAAPVPGPTAEPSGDHDGTPSYLAPTAPPGRDRRPAVLPAGRSRSRLLLASVVAGVLAVTGGVVAALLVGDGDGDDGDPSPEPPTETAFADLPPEEILTASEKEMKVLDTVRVTGQFTDDEDRRVAIRMSITADGDCSGTMSYLGSGTAEVIHKDGRTVMRPDAAFLTEFGIDGADDLLEALDGGWLALEADSLMGVCDLDEFLERDGRGDAVATQEGTTEVRGEEAVRIRLEQGPNRETYYVMLAEPHYLLRLDETEDAWFQYSEFDEQFEIELPPERRILDP
jgi:hypothetical protein